MVCKKIITSLILSFLLLTACKKKIDQQISSENSSGSLVFYNWEEYIGSETIENFYKNTGIKVIESFYEDEEEMFGAVQSNPDAYDLVVASGDLIREMIYSKILAPVDYTKIKNIKNIGKEYTNLEFDPNQKYTIPYLWGTTGLVVNKKYIKEPYDTWEVLFNKNYKDKVAMLNNPFEVFAPAFKILGKSINEIELSEINNAEKMLVEHKKISYGFVDVINAKEMLISEKIWASQIYSGEGLSAVDENENLEYIIPKEGVPIWIDNFVIPRDSKNKEAVYIFLNYLLEPEVNAKIATELWYATTNKEALKYLDSELLNNKSVFPDKEVLKNCEYFTDIGSSSRLYQSKWNDLN